MRSFIVISFRLNCISIMAPLSPQAKGSRASLFLWGEGLGVRGYPWTERQTSGSGKSRMQSLNCFRARPAKRFALVTDLRLDNRGESTLVIDRHSGPLTPSPSPPGKLGARGARVDFVSEAVQ